MQVPADENEVDHTADRLPGVDENEDLDQEPERRVRPRREGIIKDHSRHIPTANKTLDKIYKSLEFLHQRCGLEYCLHVSLLADKNHGNV
jgi:hypothetical protein